MAEEIKMPALSPTMETGRLARWLVTEGGTVRSGDIIAEIETDKATMELEAPQDGRIAKLCVPDGSDDIAVGATIALIGLAVPQADDTAPTDAAKVAVPPPPSPTPASAPAPAPESAVAGAAPHARLADKVKVSPLAARIADARGIDLASINGTGPYGRIVTADLGFEKIDAAPARTEEPANRPADIPVGDDIPYRSIPHSMMRRTIARRLTESKQAVPHFYLTARCRLDALLALRADLNASRGADAAKLSVNDLLAKAMALAMTAVPDVNVRFTADATHRYERIDLSMAVAVEGGLVTPVIRDAGAMSVSAIAARSRELADRARAGTLMPEDYAGGTASLSNLGMFGIDMMIPVLNPPQALILGIAAGVEQPWKVDGAIALATIMDATASFDHRAIDGASGARFMSAFRNLVENPLRILA